MLYYYYQDAILFIFLIVTFNFQSSEDLVEANVPVDVCSNENVVCGDVSSTSSEKDASTSVEQDLKTDEDDNNISLVKQGEDVTNETTEVFVSDDPTDKVSTNDITNENAEAKINNCTEPETESNNSLEQNISLEEKVAEAKEKIKEKQRIRDEEMKQVFTKLFNFVEHVFVDLYTIIFRKNKMRIYTLSWL